MQFKILKRNDDQSIKFEYLMTRSVDWVIPKDENGNELKGYALKSALISHISEIDESDIVEIDWDARNTLLEELELNEASVNVDILDILDLGDTNSP